MKLTVRKGRVKYISSVSVYLAQKNDFDGYLLAIIDIAPVIADKSPGSADESLNM
jgi:hypothetical protein